MGEDQMKVEYGWDADILYIKFGDSEIVDRGCWAKMFMLMWIRTKSLWD